MCDKFMNSKGIDSDNLTTDISNMSNSLENVGGNEFCSRFNVGFQNQILLQHATKCSMY